MLFICVCLGPLPVNGCIQTDEGQLACRLAASGNILQCFISWSKNGFGRNGVMAGCAGWKEMRALINSKHKTMVGVIILGVFLCMAAFTWISVAADGPPALETFELLTMHAYVFAHCMFHVCMHRCSHLAYKMGANSPYTHTSCGTHQADVDMVTVLLVCFICLFVCLVFV